MSETARQFLEIYLKHRFVDQRNFYESRKKEFSTANEQVITWKATLIGLTGLASFLAALMKIEGLQELWAILAVALPAMSTALAAYDGLFAFDRHAKLYQDAATKLQRVRGRAPDLRSGITEEEYFKLVTDFVIEAEKILQIEQGQWGQLVTQIEQRKPPREVSG